jgi:tetratricopeptide (TPR) repeat protein
MPDAEPEDRSQRASQSTNNIVEGIVLGSTIVQIGTVDAHLPAGAFVPPVPHQLPPAPRRFINREHEIRTLDGLLADHEPGRANLIVLTGMRGVGKTATCRHWAHTRVDHFDDGQLHVDLSEHRHRSRTPVSDILGSFLTALGVPEHDIPVGFPERISLYRSITANKRILLLLDNVELASEVRPLIPSTDGSLVLVGARAAIRELIYTDGGSLVRLAPLEEDTARVIIEQSIGAQRLANEVDALRELVEICAGLPIALRVCAARLAVDETRTVGSLVHELTDEHSRLRRIEVARGQSIDLVFSEAYRALTGDAARLYRLLSTYPGQSFTVRLVESLGQWTPEHAQEQIGELLDACLVETEGERYRLHVLLRIHAAGCAQHDSTDGELSDAFMRVADHYLHAVQRMDRALIPSRLRLAPDPPPVQAGGVSFNSPVEAIEWFESERASLLALLRVAQERGCAQQAWQIAEGLWLAYHNRKHAGEALEVYERGVKGAVKCGDVAAQARLLLQLSRAYMDLDDLAGAERELRVARELAVCSGNSALEGSALEFTGILQINQGSYSAAISSLEASRDIYLDLQNPRGIAIQEYHLGRALQLDGQHPQALEYLTAALGRLDHDRDGLTHGRILLHLADTQTALGHRTEAIGTLEQARMIFAAHEIPYYEALAREALGECHARAGNQDLARENLVVALAIFRALGSPRASRVSERLAALH